MNLVNCLLCFVPLELLFQLVTERRAALQLNNNNNNNSNIESDFHKPKILIDQLLSVSQDGRTFSENEINDNIYAVITGVR